MSYKLHLIGICFFYLQPNDTDFKTFLSSHVVHLLTPLSFNLPSLSLISVCLNCCSLHSHSFLFSFQLVKCSHYSSIASHTFCFSSSSCPLTFTAHIFFYLIFLTQFFNLILHPFFCFLEYVYQHDFIVHS
jgi:hypothetical protein